MATDDQAIAHIWKQMNVVGQDISNPRDYLREDLLKLVAQPENVGDLHLKLLITESQ